MTATMIRQARMDRTIGPMEFAKTITDIPRGAVSKPENAVAIIVAGGRATRMEGRDKIFADLLGKPVILHTLDAFERAPSITSMVLVVPEQKLDVAISLIHGARLTKKVRVTAGGATRQQSVQNGLASVPECNYILVHDGARACVTVKLVEDGVVWAEKWGVAVPGLPITDTAKVVTGTHMVRETLDRHSVMVVQTPQVFRPELLMAAHEHPEIDAPDDAALAEAMGFHVKVYAGDRKNIKITHPEDLFTAARYLIEAQR